MSEEVGFSANGMGSGLILSGFALTPLVAIWIFLSLRRKLKHSVPILLMLVLGAFIGCVTGELQILADEVRFAKEAMNAKAPTYSRSRQWPHSATTLAYSVDLGFWATD